MQEEINQYGIDWEGPVGIENAINVEVPDTNCPLDDEQLTTLNERVDFTKRFESYGIDCYLQTKEAVLNLLNIY